MIIKARNISLEGFLISLALMCVLVFPIGARAQVMLASGMDRQVVEVALNQSQILYLEQPVAKISVGNPDIADILILRSRQLYVVGKKLGTTNVTLWDNDNQVVSAVGIEVNHDLESLKSKLHQILPDEEIEVRSSQDAIILSGEVSSTARMMAALDLARSYQGGEEGKVLNMMQVGGAQQVMLEVQVAEVSRDFLKRIGAKFEAINANSLLTIGAGNNGTALAPSGAFIPGGGFDTVTGGLPATQILREPMTFESTGLFASFLDGDTLFDLVRLSGK